MQYTEKVMNIVKDTLSEVGKISGELQQLTARYKAEEIDGQNYRAQKAELDQRISAVRMDAMKVLQDTGAAYRAKVEKAAEIDGSMLHEDAKLLQLDMKMSAHQFETLVEKHKGNPLMAQLLQEYSSKHEGLYAGFIPTADAKATAFDQFISSAQNTIRTPDNLPAAMFQEGRYTPAYCTESE